MVRRAVVCLLTGVAVSACLDDVELPPKPPVVFPVTSPTTVPLAQLKGTRPANTAVLNGETVVVESGADTSWSFGLPLVPGENRVELWTQRPSGLKSNGATVVTIEYEPACPAVAVLDALPPSPTNQGTHTLSGSKPKDTSVVLNDVVVVPQDALTTFTHPLTLPTAEGANAYVLTTRDAKGRDSDPLRFSVTYDVTAPQRAQRYPTSATDPVVVNTNIPTNALVYVELSEAVRAPGGAVPANLVAVSAASVPVAGTTTYLPAANTLLWTPTAPLAASTTFDVTVDAASLSDLAGNPAQTGAAWSWSFTTGAGPDSTAPAAPTASTPATAATATADVSGTREAWSAIEVNGEVVVPPGASTAWTAKVPLALGANPLAVSARTPTGVITAGPVLAVTRTQQKPAAPVVDSSVPTSVTSATVAVTGTRPANTAVLLNGVPVVCVGSDTTFAFAATLSPGANELRLTTRDENGVESDAAVYTITLEQQYSGKVPPGWQLKVFVSLRDLNGTRVASEFVTGANNYGIDAWVEGPVGPGDACEWDAALKQRKNVKYVGTITHYIGAKAGHNVPFADEDYRGTDYLAGLAAGGRLEFRGITATSPRRDGQGRELSTLMAGVGEQDLRQNFDCFGLTGVDGCTGATVTVGTHQLPAWEPRRAPTAEVADQGDYLLWVQLNLDRGPTWLVANDFETCWGNPADFARGMHRVVRRVSLGGSAWSVNVTPAEELAGPDPDSAGEVRYLSPQGMTISWGPP